MDVDALLFSMAKTASPSGIAASAAIAVAAGILSNTLLKTGLALVISRGSFRRVAGTGLAVMAAAAAVSIYLLR